MSINYTPDAGDDLPRISRQDEVVTESSEFTPTPALVRAVAHAAITGNDRGLVDTSNYNLTSSFTPPLLDRPSHKKPNHKITRRVDQGPHINHNRLDEEGQGRPQKTLTRYISYPLRTLYQAVEGLCEVNEAMHAVTVYFSQEVSEALRGNKKGAVVGYAERVKLRFDRAGISFKNYFFVLEESASGGLHAHFVAAFDPQLIKRVRELLKADGAGEDSDVKIQAGYWQYHSASPGTPEWELLELDSEFDLNQYELHTLESGRQRWRRRVPVNIGWADYISKDLHRRLQGIPGQHYYAPIRVKKAAAELYEEKHVYQRSQCN